MIVFWFGHAGATEKLRQKERFSKKLNEGRYQMKKLINAEEYQVRERAKAIGAYTTYNYMK